MQRLHDAVPMLSTFGSFQLTLAYQLVIFCLDIQLDLRLRFDRRQKHHPESIFTRPAERLDTELKNKKELSSWTRVAGDSSNPIKKKKKKIEESPR